MVTWKNSPHCPPKWLKCQPTVFIRQIKYSLHLLNNESYSWHYDFYAVLIANVTKTQLFFFSRAFLPIFGMKGQMFFEGNIWQWACVSGRFTRTSETRINSPGHTLYALILGRTFWQRNQQTEKRFADLRSARLKKLFRLLRAEVDFSICPVCHCQHTHANFRLPLLGPLISDVICCRQLILASFVQNHSNPPGFSFTPYEMVTCY